MAWQGSLTEHQLRDAEPDDRTRDGVPTCERPHDETCWCQDCEDWKVCGCVDCKGRTIGEGGQNAPHPRNGPSWLE